MNYIRIYDASSGNEIRINKEQFSEYKNAKQTLDNALQFEEKYEIVIHSYIEFEEELTRILIESVVRKPIDYLDFFNIRLTSSVKIMTLLNSAKLYTDSLPKYVKDCFEDSEKKEIKKKEIQDILNKEMKENWYYGFAFILRNHGQHNNLLIHNCRLNPKWYDDRKQKEYSLGIFVNKKALSKDERSMKKNNIEIFQKMKEEVDLVLAIRHYIETISKIHIEARKLVDSRVNEARKLVESAINKFTEPTEFIFLHIIHQSNIVEENWISLRWDDIRLSLLKKNKLPLTNLHKSYVTTQIKE